MTEEVKPKSRKKTEAVQVIATEERMAPAIVAHTPDMLIAMAIQKGVDMDQLNKLMDLQDRWLARKAREEYFIAFAKFQSIAPELKKNKQVKFDHKDGGGKTEYKYQELSDIAQHIRGPLAECGLSYKWAQSESGNEITVTCIVSHVGGHEERGEPLKGAADSSGKKNLIQQKASTITYLKRYTLMGILGLSTGDQDNDGQGGAKGSDTSVDMPPLTDNQFAATFKKVMAGEWKVEEVKKNVILTEKQEQALQKAQDEREAKKA